MKTASRSSVAVSLGRRARKRMIPSPARVRAGDDREAEDEQRVREHEPRIDVCATTISPAASENSTMKSSGRLPSVDWRTPVTAGPKCEPTDSVADADRPREAARERRPRRGRPRPGPRRRSGAPLRRAATAKIAPSGSHCLTSCAASRLRRSGRPRLLTKPIRSYIAWSVGSDIFRAFSAPRARRRWSSTGSERSSPVALLDRNDCLDDRLADVGLELAVTDAVVARLDRVRGLRRDRREDVNEVRDAGLVRRATHLGCRSR